MSISQDYQEYFHYLTSLVSGFHKTRLEKIQELDLQDILKRKNPYLYKAKNIETGEGLVKSILDAYLSSQEETIFGNLLEKFAIYIAKNLYSGFKSSFQSIDLEFEKENTYYIVSIKSGPHWGNRDQISRMKSSFKEAKSNLIKKGIAKEIVAVNGCVYGKEKISKKCPNGEEHYYKYCGQEFWAFISGDRDFYWKIIEPIGKKAKQQDTSFKKAYHCKVNELTKKFLDDFITQDHCIDWKKLVDFVSRADTKSL
ncbi:MAG: cytosolic protein [Candidatus Brocadiae bacterium]|nr:cytosolic protein [Candidatus Brocadiia bacterium]